MLQAAQDHLNNCVAFGLQSRYDASVSLFQDVLGWTEYEPTPPQAKTKKRPSLEEIDDLNPTVLPQLRESHQLDTQLHQYAVDLFDTQF
jgi:hypothetical protein